MYEKVSVIVSVTLCWGISMGSGENHQLEHNNLDVIFRSPVNICVTSIEVIIIVLRLIRLKVAKLWENQKLYSFKSRNIMDSSDHERRQDNIYFRCQ